MTSPSSVRAEYLECGGNVGRGERVVAPGLERVRQPGEDSAPVVRLTVLAFPMHELLRGSDLAADASTIAWWPRQTPSVGIVGPAGARSPVSRPRPPADPARGR